MKKLLMLLPLVGCFACDSSPEMVNTPRQEMIELLTRAGEQRQTLYGHQDDTAYGHSWKYEAHRSDTKELVGDYPAIIGWDIGLIEFDSLANLDGVPFDFMRKEIIAHDARGGINTLSWHAYNPVDGSNSWQTNHGVVSSLLKGGEHHTKLRQSLEKVADFLLSLRDDSGEVIPIIFRPWHEHTGSWFWWGRDFCTPDQWRELWDITHQYMLERGLGDYIVWAVSPGGGDPYYEERLPSPNNFDLIGVDCYHFGGDEGVDRYKSTLRQSFEKMERLSQELNKPMALTEGGQEALTVENWWCDVLMDVVEEYPICYVLTWRNAWDRPEHFYSSYKGHHSEGDFVEFYNLPTTAFLSELNKLRK